MPAVSTWSRSRSWTLGDSYAFIATFCDRSATTTRRSGGFPQAGPSSYPFNSQISTISTRRNVRPKKSFAREILARDVRHNVHSTENRRYFHDYFVTHLPSSSLHPDSRSSAGPHHKLPRSASTPHTSGSGPSPAAAPPMVGVSRELTVVRIPLRSAKHHFGVSVSRGTRPYNEDSYQAGTIAIPAFAKRAPISLSRKGPNTTQGGTNAGNQNGDPQVFYFGVFDGHGGHECSDFLRQELHIYLEEAASTFGLKSSLKKYKPEDDRTAQTTNGESIDANARSSTGREALESIETVGESDIILNVPSLDNGRLRKPPAQPALASENPVSVESDKAKAVELQKALVLQWKETVGGYFRRFRPEHFSIPGSASAQDSSEPMLSIESVLMYAFLKADLEFVTAQAQKPDEHSTDKPLNADEVFGKPSVINQPHKIGGSKRFQGGSTASIAMISTPTPTPFWHPASPSTLLVAHVGDTRIILCDTATGIAQPVTTNHHPSSPVEGSRLRRYAATFVTDSFGEERMSGLANTRAFGDMRSKRIGVSAEPEIRRVELAPAQYSFIVLVSDGVSGTLTDQEIVDIVREAKTPEQGARDVVSFATEVSKEGDNATCLVVRLGGWERRIEGGMGSMGTKEVRDFRKGDALDPRSRRT